jgi:hypothetical protein
MQIISKALDKFSADKIALPDFALESGGLYKSTRISHQSKSSLLMHIFKTY